VTSEDQGEGERGLLGKGRSYLLAVLVAVVAYEGHDGIVGETQFL
jgi:hypothetical protein